MLLQIANSTVANAGFQVSTGFNNIVIGLLLIAVAVLVLWKLRNFIVNSALGVIALFLLGFIGITVPVNLVTIIIAGVLGLVGVGLMVLLVVLGFRF